MIKRLLTRNLTKIPLLWINFDLKHFKSKGKVDSCILHVHPNLRNDDHIKNILNELVDYIRENYEMKEM